MTIYYVKNAGSDAADGLSDANAWATIAKVNATSFSAGDSILFNKGDTWREQLTVPSSGSSGSPITFGAYGSGNKPIIDGADIKTTWTTVPLIEEIGGVFASGFEDEVDAMTTDFTSKTEANSNTISITTALGTYNHGAKGAKIDYAGTAGAGTYFQKNYGSNAKYHRCYFKLNSAFAAGAAGQTLNLLIVNNPDGWGGLADIQLVSDAGQTTKFHLIGRYRYPGAGFTTVFTGADDTIQRNTWYYIEIHYEKNTSATIEYWLNGVSQGSAAAINTDSYNPNGIILGGTSWSNMVPTVDSEIYYDDVKSDTSAVGAYSVTDIPDVYQTSCSTTPNQIFRDNLRATKGSDVTTLNDHEWYHSSGTLYYKDLSGDPDGLDYVITASARDYNIDENGKDYITIQNMTLQNSNTRGLYFSLAANMIIIDACTVSKAFQSGIRTITGQATHNVTLKNSTLNWNGGSGLGLNKTSYDWTITGNIIHNNSQYDVSAVIDQEYGGGMYLWCDDGSLQNILITNNIVYSNGVFPDSSRVTNAGGGKVGIGIWLDTVTNADYTTASIVAYNHVYDNTYRGIHLEHTTYCKAYYNLVRDNVNAYGISVQDYSHTTAVNYNLIYNNTLYNNSWGGLFVSGASTGVVNTCVGNVFKNNIVLETSRALIAKYGGENDGTWGSGNIYINNCFGAESSNFIEWGDGVYKSTYDAWETAYGGSTYSVELDPLFVNPGTDFHLQSISPCINAGVDVGLTQDYDGKLVPRGAAPDVGAYEYQTSGQSLDLDMSLLM